MSTRAAQFQATVRRREPLSDHLVRLVLDDLDGFTSTGVPDEWVGLVVPGQFQSRYYTVRSFERGELTPVIDRTYPLSKTPDAVRYLEDGHPMGKIVVTVADT